MSERVRNAKAVADDVIERTERAAEDVGKSVSRAAGALRDQVSDVASDVDWATTRESIERHTRSNPLSTLIAAGLIGIVIGHLFSRRRS